MRAKEDPFLNILISMKETSPSNKRMSVYGTAHAYEDAAPVGPSLYFGYAG
jgi:hypothetical protein